MRGAVIMKSSLQKARKINTNPNWILDSTWDILCQHWASKEFKIKSMTGKENWASNFGSFLGSLHTCDFITTSQHRYNMVICLLTTFFL